MKRSLLFFTLLLFFLCGQAFGFDIQGLQPLEPNGVFSTFSAESCSKGKAAFSVGAEVSREPDFYRFTFKSSFGILDNLEMLATVPYVTGYDPGDGFEDISIGLKHRFFDEGKYGPSLAYVLNGSLPSGPDQLSTDGQIGLGLIMSKRVGPVNGHVNLFYSIPGESRLDEQVSLLAGLDFAAAYNFKLLAELYVRQSYNANTVDLIEGRLGYRIQTTDFIYTTVGVGYDFKNRNPEYRILFSVTFLYPYDKKKIKKVYEEE